MYLSSPQAKWTLSQIHHFCLPLLWDWWTLRLLLVWSSSQSISSTDMFFLEYSPFYSLPTTTLSWLTFFISTWSLPWFISCYWPLSFLCSSGSCLSPASLRTTHGTLWIIAYPAPLVDVFPISILFVFVSLLIITYHFSPAYKQFHIVPILTPSLGLTRKPPPLIGELL